MEATLEKVKNRTQRINYYLSALKQSQPEALENGLRTMYLRTLVQKLDSSVLANDITMQEIVDEVKAARRERYEKFDVNIWLSYFISGKSEKIIEMIENNDVFFYRSLELMSELKDVINRPKFAKYFSNGTEEYILGHFY